MRGAAASRAAAAAAAAEAARAAAKLEAILKTPLWAHAVGCGVLSLGCIALAGVLYKKLHEWADAAEAEEVRSPGCWGSPRTHTQLT